MTALVRHHRFIEISIYCLSFFEGSVPLNTPLNTVAAAYGLPRNAVDQIRSRATRKLRELAATLAARDY